MRAEDVDEEFATRSMPTPEGRAFYPCGRTGVLVDAQTERRIKLYLRWRTWVITAVAVAAVQLPFHFLVKLLVASLAGGAVNTLIFKLILWGSPRTDVRLARPVVASGALAYHDVYRLLVLFLAGVLFFFIGALLASSTLDRWLFAAAGFAFVLGCAVFWSRAAYPRRRREGG